MRRIIEYIGSFRISFGISRFGSWLLFGTLIGIASGLGAVFFTFGIQLCSDFFFGNLAGYAMPSLGSESPGGTASDMIGHRLEMIQFDLKE